MNACIFLGPFSKFYLLPREVNYIFYSSFVFVSVLLHDQIIFIKDFTLRIFEKCRPLAENGYAVSY